MANNRIDGAPALERAKAAVKDKFGEELMTTMEDFYMVMQSPDNKELRKLSKDVAAAYILACANNKILYKEFRRLSFEAHIASVESITRRIHLLRNMGVITIEKLDRPAKDDGHHMRGRKAVVLGFNEDAFMTVYHAAYDEAAEEEVEEDEAVIEPVEEVLEEEEVDESMNDEPDVGI